MASIEVKNTELESLHNAIRYYIENVSNDTQEHKRLHRIDKQINSCIVGLKVRDKKERLENRLHLKQIMKMESES